MIEIEKDVPLPDGARQFYPFTEMQIGDSFFTTSPVAKVYSAIYWWRKRHSGKFTCRTVEGGTRVWRIE